jgi:hypothetical protein
LISFFAFFDLSFLATAFLPYYSASTRNINSSVTKTTYCIYDEAGVIEFFNRPRWREATWGWH